MRFLPVNLDALLVELDDLPQTLALLASLQDEPMPGIEEIVPAARTLLIRHRPAELTQTELVERLAARPLAAADRATGTRVEIPVHYDGEDLAEVAALLALSPEELVRRHTGHDYTVAFTGFAPGFAYLSGGDPILNVPRRRTPRTRIPAGAVALAGPFSGVYPQASPGGWQLIGTTGMRMWDLTRDRPALLQPGQRVRFVDAGPAGAFAATITAAATSLIPPPTGSTVLEVLRPGAQALFQDLGRAGQAGQGVSASGAMDRASLRAANRLVGNPFDSAALEIAQGGFQLRCHGEAVVAVTGADGPLTLCSAGGACWPVPRQRPIALGDGDTLEFGDPTSGMRSYLAARGGFLVRPVLGSCATDVLAHLGPPPLAAGDRIALGKGGNVVGDETPPLRLPAPGEAVTLDVVMGPRTDWFTSESVDRLATQCWRVTPQSSRVGIRLDGAEPLGRAPAFEGVELPSEGTVRGALQVPPSGQPVLFLADHPLTGGYPVIATVAPYHLDLAGQIPIGAKIRLRPIRPFAPLEQQSDAGSSLTPSSPRTP